MKRLLFLIFLPLVAYSADNDTITVSMQIDPINLIEITGPTPSLLIDNAIGGEPEIDTFTGVTYGYLSNESTLKQITASLDLDMPTGLRLKVEMVAATSATSTGNVELSSTASALVTSIPAQTTDSNLAITYTLEADGDTASPASFQRVVTYTLTDN